MEPLQISRIMLLLKCLVLLIVKDHSPFKLVNSLELNGLIQQIKAFEQLTIEAAVTGNKQKALLALTTNPFVPSSKVAKLLLDEILEVNQAYLPQFSMKALV